MLSGGHRSLVLSTADPPTEVVATPGSRNRGDEVGRNADLAEQGLPPLPAASVPGDVPGRRASVVRKWPELCGRDVPRVSKAGCEAYRRLKKSRYVPQESAESLPESSPGSPEESAAPTEVMGSAFRELRDEVGGNAGFAEEGDPLASNVSGERPLERVPAVRKRPAFCGRGVPRVDKEKRGLYLMEKNKTEEGWKEGFLPDKVGDEGVLGGDDLLNGNNKRVAKISEIGSGRVGAAKAYVKTQGSWKMVKSMQQGKAEMGGQIGYVTKSGGQKEVFEKMRSIAIGESADIGSLKGDRVIGGFTQSQFRQGVEARFGDQRIRQNGLVARAIDEVRPSQFGGQAQGHSKMGVEARERVTAVSSSTKPAKSSELVGTFGGLSGVKMNLANQKLVEAKKRLQKSAASEPRKSKASSIGGEVGARLHPGAAKQRFMTSKAKSSVKIADEQNREVVLGLKAAADCPWLQAPSRVKVKASLRFFQFWCRKLLQKAEAENMANVRFRMDAQAYEMVKKSNRLVNTGLPIVGMVPGVEVGDEFQYRLELCIIGLHRRTVAGIDYLRGTRCLATSIVSSGVYDDKIDASDVMIYTGEGGRPKGKTYGGEDQRLSKGNLGLKNCIVDLTPVRVIRGIREIQHQSSKQIFATTYVYYGLYRVEECWSEKGRHGFLEFKFRLRRLPGQPQLTVGEAKSHKKFKEREGIYVTDISKGKEQMPIPAVNTVDNEMPPSFNYVSKIVYPTPYKLEFLDGCSCIDGCFNSSKCWCSIKNDGEIPFNRNGAIVCPKPIVYECGPACSCPPHCYNRVGQKGIKLQLEIFKTVKKGWALRCLSVIPSGSFICEYVGEVLEDAEAEKRIGRDEYLFDIGRSHNDKFFENEQTYTMLAQVGGISGSREKESGYTIDAANYGNVGRFINHSCVPNLYAQNVLYDHDDLKLPHVMFFAAENIPAFEELTCDYNYAIDQVFDSNGNIKKKKCFCGAAECSGRLY